MFIDPVTEPEIHEVVTLSPRINMSCTYKVYKLHNRIFQCLEVITWREGRHKDGTRNDYRDRNRKVITKK